MLAKNYNRRMRRIMRSKPPLNRSVVSTDEVCIPVEEKLGNDVWKKAYAYKGCDGIDWKTYAEKIYVVRSEPDNERADKRLSMYGIPRDMVIVIPVDTKALYSARKYPLGDALYGCLSDMREKMVKRAIVLTDDFCFISEENTRVALDESLKYDFALLNPGDITCDCFSLTRDAADTILSKLVTDRTRRGWFGGVVKSIKSGVCGFSVGKVSKPLLVHAIDFVFPYVDCSDPYWVDCYNANCDGRKLQQNRFRSYGLLVYLFRGIDTYMPFIRDVVLIVQSESQVPEWVDTNKVRVVYHRDFIPAKHLPTFNSCTIESYIPRIKGLSEHVIYSNDDIYPINNMAASDFYIAGVPQFSIKSASGSNIYRRQCRNSYEMANREFGIKKSDSFKKPSHISTPMLKQCLRHINDVYCEDIDRRSSKFRTVDNINQYVYPLYQKNLIKGGDVNVSYEYLEFSDGMSKICRVIDGNSVKMICINDSGSNNFETVMMSLKKSFDKKLHGKSRFEK